MRIKKFKIFYGGYFATNYEVTKYRSNLVFRQWEYSPMENSTNTVKLTPDQWSALVETLVSITRDWQPIYDSGACDGIQWTVDLKTDTTRIKVDGSNEYPENFDSLIELIRRIKGFELFADGHNVE